jgi:hypothetical protein
MPDDERCDLQSVRLFDALREKTHETVELGYWNSFHIFIKFYKLEMLIKVDRLVTYCLSPHSVING